MKIEDILEDVYISAGLANYTLAQLQSDDASLKYYRDLKNSLDTAKDEGRVEGRVQGRAEGRIEERIEITLQMLNDGESVEKIMRYSKFNIEQIKNIKNENRGYS